MTSEAIQGLADEIKDFLNASSPEDARLVQRGLMLYRQGLVHQLHIKENEITATVQDVIPVKVMLDPHFYTLSECSCPNEEGLCRHLMAVFFAAYATVGSVATWVEEWREPAKEKEILANWGMQTAKDLIKANRILKPDYGQWVHSFEVSFDTLMETKKYTSPFVIPELFDIYMRRINASAPVEQEWRLLYELVANVISFRKLAMLSDKSGHSEDAVKRSYLHLFHQILDDTEDAVGKIGVVTLPFDFDEFVMKLMCDALELLTIVNSLERERVYLYRVLWTGLFRNKAWRQEELSRIKERLKALKDWENPVPLMIAEVHIHILLGDDEQAMKQARLIGDDQLVPYLLHWIEFLTGQKAWKRVAPLVDLFLQKVRGYLEELGSYHSCSSFTRTLLKAIAPYCVETGRTELFERALLQTLPYSFADYEYLLFERGQYERWGELQAFVGLNYYDLPKDRVKMIEKENPELLLGVLHQTVQSEIDQKNRQSYKAAVRHLKKLRTIYKKLKRVDDWTFFMETLLERTKRLRAFHEECVRGKLVEVEG